MLQEVEKKKILNHTKKLGNVQFLGYLKSQTETLHTIFSIEKYLENHPAFYLNSVLTFLKGRDLPFIKQYIVQEEEKLLKGTSFLHRMNANINGRMKCINKIRRDLTRASKVLNLFQKQYFEDTSGDAIYNEWVELEGYSAIDVDESIENSIKLMSNIFLDMSRLRDMTIYIVENVHKWIYELEEHADRCQQHSPIHYLYQDVDIYQMILSDTNFIWTSKLSSYIWMEAKQDPFMIRNVIHIEQRETKTPLEKYFLEILTPKAQITIEKSLQCFQMLIFKYKPKLINQFQEEEMLIENYLKLQMKNHQFDEQYKDKNQQEQSSITNLKKYSKQIGSSPEKKNRLNIRGWVFQKNTKSKNRQKINQIINNHNEKLNIVRPFNISNYAEKNSIALAYLSEMNNKGTQGYKNRIASSIAINEKQKHFFSEGEDYKQEIQKEEKHYQSETQLKKVEPRMFKSLTKLHPVILEDPKQHLPDTPKNKSKAQLNPLSSRQPSLKHIKLNSFEPVPQQEEEKIEVDQEETPINIKQFFQVFRADTNKIKKKQFAFSQRKEGEPEKLINLKQFLQKSRKQRANSLQSKKTSTIYFKQKKKQSQKQKNKSLSYADFTVVKNETENKLKYGQKLKDIACPFINLKTKSIPYDLIVPYVKHLASQQHTTSHSFTDFKISEVLKKLSDPFIHCIIFDVFTEKHEHLGQVILSENMNGRAGKLKYTVEFMNIHLFQFVISTVLRISEELLATSPCQQVIFPFIVDKLDLISTHFIQLIDGGLREKVDKFGKLAILQKSRPSYKGTDVRERLYVFTSQGKIKPQYEIASKMMLGNYRSLKFQARCLIMCSNWRLRSKNTFKDTMNKYKNIAIGELYVRAMSKILTKYHLKQLKSASFSMDTEDEFTQYLRKDMFLRNIIHNLMIYLEDNHEDELLRMTNFHNMTDLMHYLRYKKFDSDFQIEFLEESRFILSHQLILVEFEQEASLDFALTSNNEIYVMHNHNQTPIIRLKSKNVETAIYLISTPNDKIKIFFMSGIQYLNSTTDQLDLFSYLSYFFKDIHSQVSLNSVPAIVLPNLKQRNTRVSPMRMYDGFFKLFPQRQFYSAAMVSCLNHWDGYYPNAVIHLPKENSIVFDYPLVVGFYDAKLKYPSTAFLYTEENLSS